MTAPVVLERAVAPEKSPIVRPGIILKKDVLEEAVGPRDRRFSAGWHVNYAKFIGDTACCIAEKVGGGAYKVLSYCSIGSPEACRVTTY